MDSFISWIGGKKALREKIKKEFPEKGTYKCYVEVFGGAGWILFSSLKHAETEIYNDVNGDLVNLFRCVKYHPEEVQRELDLVLTSREQFYDAKGQMGMRGLTDIQRAARFFTMVKESYGTDLRSFGTVFRNMNKAKEYLTAVSERLGRVVIENMDFEKIIRSKDREDTLFYLDPPYYGTEQYYSAKFVEEDHIRLKETLRDVRGRFVLSYNDSEYIRELYREYDITEVERIHNLMTAKGTIKYRELVIRNFV